MKAFANYSFSSAYFPLILIFLISTKGSSIAKCKHCKGLGLVGGFKCTMCNSTRDNSKDGEQVIQLAMPLDALYKGLRMNWKASFPSHLSSTRKLYFHFSKTLFLYNLISSKYTPYQPFDLSTPNPMLRFGANVATSSLTKITLRIANACLEHNFLL
jgi:hypothetical protein